MAEDDNEQKNQPPATPDFLKTIDEFLGRSEFNIELSYSYEPDQETIVLPVRLLMNEDEVATRQKFYAQPAAEREPQLHKYRVQMLASLLSGTPSGLKHWAEFADWIRTSKRNATDAEILEAYLMRGGPMAIKIAEQGLDQYYNRTQPAEFFR